MSKEYIIFELGIQSSNCESYLSIIPKPIVSDILEYVCPCQKKYILYDGNKAMLIIYAYGIHSCIDALLRVRYSIELAAFIQYIRKFFILDNKYIHLHPDLHISDSNDPENEYHDNIILYKSYMTEFIEAIRRNDRYSIKIEYYNMPNNGNR